MAKYQNLWSYDSTTKRYNYAGAPSYTNNPVTGQPLPGGDVFRNPAPRGGHFADTIEPILNYGGANASWLDSEENKRQASETEIIKQGLPAANKPTLSQETIDSQFGAAADSTGQQYLNNMQSLRDTLGGNGVTGGGLGPALASQYALARAGQVTDARRSLMLEKVKTDASDAARNFQNTLIYADQVGKGPSMINQDWLQNVLGLRLNQMGVEAQDTQASKAADANKIAGWIGLGGGIAKGLLGGVA